MIQEPVDFHFDPTRATQAAAYLLKLAGGSMDAKHLMLLLYLADRELLARRQRSITGAQMSLVDRERREPVLTEIQSLLTIRAELLKASNTEPVYEDGWAAIERTLQVMPVRSICIAPEGVTIGPIPASSGITVLPADDPEAWPRIVGEWAKYIRTEQGQAVLVTEAPTGEMSRYILNLLEGCFNEFGHLEDVELVDRIKCFPEVKKNLAQSCDIFNLSPEDVFQAVGLPEEEIQEARVYAAEDRFFRSLKDGTFKG